MNKESINLSIKYGESKMSEDYLDEHQHKSLKKIFVKMNEAQKQMSSILESKIKRKAIRLGLNNITIQSYFNVNPKDSSMSHTISDKSEASGRYAFIIFDEDNELIPEFESLTSNIKYELNSDEKS